MSHNPYAPPTVGAAATTPASSTEVEARRLAHIVAERRILMAGSTQLTLGFMMFSTLGTYGSLEHLLDSGVFIAVTLANLAAGVLLWRLHPVGRWLFLVSFGVMDALGIAQGVQDVSARAVFWFLLMQLSIGLALWRPRARPVFQAEYRDVIVPATPGVRRWGVGFILFHALLMLINLLSALSFIIHVF